MAVRSRRDLRQNADIWPGFVDALATLLLVIIFLLVVFVLGQFFLSQLLEGKDTRLNTLEQAIAELTAQLDLEQATSDELRLSVTQLSSDLQSALADRDDRAAELADAMGERDGFRDRILLLEDEQALLNQTLTEMRQEAARVGELETELARTTDLRARLQEELAAARSTIAADQATIELQLAQLIQLRRDIEALQEIRDQLDLEVAEMAAVLEVAETAKTEAAAEIARLTDLLAAAAAQADALGIQVTELGQSVEQAGRETSSLEEEVTRLSALLASLRDEKAASDRQVSELDARLGAMRAELDLAREQRAAQDQEVARLGALFGAAQGERESRDRRITELSAQLEATRAESGQREQRIAELSEQLDVTRSESGERERRIAELSALLQQARETRGETASTVEELRAAREQLLLELGQVRDRSSALESELAAAEERTLAAQRDLDARDLRIDELLRSAGRSEEALATEQVLSSEALKQVEILNRQIVALRVQLAALEQALELEQERVEEQQVTIADLGSKLNIALAGKVEELSRFRSEFFGRLRQVLGDRADVRIVGDRFVFQSEVLFPTASADIEVSGQDQLRKLADSLREIAAEMPSDLPWVLQINGHTDRRPISTPDFPSNWELSTERAINVGKFLIRQGISPSRIAVAGFAQYQPLDDRRDEIAYRRNRRIEIKLTTP